MTCCENGDDIRFLVTVVRHVNKHCDVGKLISVFLWSGT